MVLGGGTGMLLIQHIKLYWNKECRGAPYSTFRNQMPKAYNLPKDFFKYNPLGYPSHYIYFVQEKGGLKEEINRIDTLTEYENIRMGAVEIIKRESGHELRYRYDFHRAIPERHKYDPKTCLYKPLNEIALSLFSNEYGRIIHNGRHVDYDTGDWYYNIDIINIINVTGNKIPLDIFSKKEPDKPYNQIAVLR